MAEPSHVLYESMFLMSQGANLEAGLEHVREILDRAEAEVLTVRKWDERRLAYPVKGQKRGVFLLALFRVVGAQIANIERDCNLSESILRVLVMRGDHMGEIEIQQGLREAETTETEVKLRGKTDGKPDATSDKPRAAEPDPAPKVSKAPDDGDADGAIAAKPDL